MINVFLYGQLTIVEDKNNNYNVFHNNKKLNNEPFIKLNKAYDWSLQNYEELTKEVKQKKSAEWGDDGFDYHNYYSGGQP